jgi:hypothetical protein
MSLRVWSASPARDGLDEVSVDLVAAAHLLRGEGLRGREHLEGPLIRDLRLWAGSIGGGSLAL